MIPVALVAQMHLVFVYLLYSPVAECRFPTLAGQILDYRISSVQIGFGVHYPICLHELMEPRIDFRRTGDPLQFTVLRTVPQTADHLPPKNSG